MTQKENSSVGWLRLIALLEGISFLLILFVSMPLKYIWGMPSANIYIGYSHGLLFILYVITIIIMADRLKWNVKTIFLALLASVIPFGTFWADKAIFRKYQTV